jgi:hypothetical protein
MELRKRGYLNEKRVAAKDFAVIARLTDRNDHNTAMMEGAKLLGLKSLAKKLELIGKLHILEGHMPGSLLTYRRSLYDELMAVAKKKLSPKNYDAFYGSF